MFPTLTTILRSLAVILIATMPPAQDRATAQTENQPIASRRLTESRISFVAHHNSGEAVWAVTEKGQIHIVDPLTLEPLTQPQHPFDTATICGAGLLPDQSGMLLCGYGGLVIPVGTANFKTAAWQAGNGIRPIAGAQFQSIAISPAGTAVALGTGDGSVALIDMNSGALLWTVSVAEIPINFVAWSDDGKQLAACSGNWRRAKDPGVVFLLDPADGKVIKRLTDHRGQVNQVAFSPDGKSLASTSSDSRLLTYNLQDLDKPPTELVRSPGITAVRFLDNRHCVVSIYGGGVEVCDLQQSRTTIRFAGHRSPPAPAANPDAAASAPKPRPPLVRAVSVSPDGTHLVTTDFNGMAHVWSLSSAEASPSQFVTTHWNADHGADFFKVGTFAAADEQGRPTGWEDLSAFEAGNGQLQTRGRGTLTLSSPDVDSTNSISTAVRLPPETRFVTFVVVLRGPTIQPTDQTNAGGGVTVAFVDSQGQDRAMPPIEPQYAGYRDWTTRIHTARVFPGEQQVRVRVALPSATGELEVDNILMIPSDSKDEATAEQIRILRLALEHDDSNSIIQLIKDDPRMLEMRAGQSDNGTPLIQATWGTGSPKVAAKLIELGADIEARDHTWGNTPLGWCSWWGNHEVAAVLLKAGADFRGISRRAQSAKTANRWAKRSPDDFDQLSRLVDEHEAKVGKP